MIVAVDGLATAGGCEIVLAADLVVATTRSSFGLAEVKRNLVAGAGGLFRLPRAIGQAAAMEAILTGEPIPAERAYAPRPRLPAGRAGQGRRARPWRLAEPDLRRTARSPCGPAARSCWPPPTRTTRR